MVIHNIVRGFVRFAFYILFVAVKFLIYLICGGWHDRKHITVTKAKRIRFLTKIKLWFLNSVPEWVIRYLGIGGYKNYLNSHLNHGMQLRYDGTDKCAV